MRENSLTELDFDTAMELARSDPEAFERYRRNVIEALIARAPERSRQHLRRLQWRIDQERQRASNPTAAFLKLYRMMWDSFAGEYGLIDTICNARPDAQCSDQLPASAEVIVFPGIATKRRSSRS